MPSSAFRSTSRARARLRPAAAERGPTSRRRARGGVVWLLAALPLVLGGCGDPADDAATAPTGGRPSPQTGSAADGGTPGGAATDAASTGPAADGPVAAARRAFIDRLRDEPLGAGVTGDLGLDDGLLGRATDRLLQEQFQDQSHRVFADVPEPSFEDGPAGEPSRPVSFEIEPHLVDEAVLIERGQMPSAQPPNRGFHAGPVPGLEDLGPWPVLVEIEAVGEEAVAALIARGLVRDGLGATTVRAIAASLEADRRDGARGDAGGGATAGDRATAILTRLRRLGLPVDLVGLIPSFDASDARRAPADPVARITDILERLDAGDDVDALAERVAALGITWRPSVIGFRPSVDDGSEPLGLIRVQPTRGTFWAGRGGGGTLDVTASLLAALPEQPFVVSVPRPAVSDALPRLAVARQDGRARVTIVDEPHVVSQWAQDNGQPGTVAGDRAPVLLAPRFASRGDIGSRIAAGDTWLVDGLTNAGVQVVRSPLLFQGGNMLIVRDPAGPGLLLLVGEAEIARNRALGLQRDDVLEAFRVEFGVQRVVVLEPDAFHVDFATTVRRVGDRSIAFVHDADAAMETVLRRSVERLRDAGTLPPDVCDTGLAALAAGDRRGFLDAIGPSLYAVRRSDGMWPLSIAMHLQDGATDSAVGNLDRFLSCFERLMGLVLRPEQVPGDDVTRTYVTSFARMATVAAQLRTDLEAEGFEVVALPGLSMQRRSINTVNMLHGASEILMPTTGGLFAPIDDEARARVASAVGSGIRIIPIPCSETQRRSGGVLCAVSAWTRPEGGG